MSTPSDGTRFAGVHSDGRFATASPVSVRFTGGGLELRSDREMGSRTWPYDRLQGSVPLRADTPDVLLSLLPDGAETLFVADPSFSGLLLARAPALSCARQRWQGLKPGLAVLAAVLLIVSGVWLLDLHPAQTIARVMPQKTRAALGGAAVTSMTKDRKVCETPASKAALGRLTQRLTAAASDKPLGVRVVLLDWSLVNAFAVPGGQIILTRGLVQRAGASDEVAGVLAHELGHTLELHPEAGIIRVVGLSAALQLALAGSQGTISNIGLILTQLRYTRIAERARHLDLEGDPPIAPVPREDFFERLESNKPGEEAGKSASELEMILRTHPPTAERIAMVRAQPTYPATPALSADDWRALRDACGPPTARPAPSAPPAAGPTATGPTASRAPTNPTPTPPIAVRPDTEAGREIAEATNALATNPNDVAALQKRARAYTKENRHEQALGDYTKASELKSDDAALHYGRGTALQNLRRYEHQPCLEALRRRLAGFRRAGPDPARFRPRLFQSRPSLSRYEPERGSDPRLRRRAGAGQGLHCRPHHPRHGAREDGSPRQGHRGFPHRVGHAAEIQQRRLGPRHRARASENPRRRRAVTRRRLRPRQRSQNRA